MNRLSDTRFYRSRSRNGNRASSLKLRWGRENLLLLGRGPGGQSRLHIERRQPYESPHSFALDFLAGRRPLSIERRLGKRRSGRRFFQKSWPVNFEGFSTSAGAATTQEGAEHPATCFPNIKCTRGKSESNRRAIETCQRREAYSHCAPGFSRTCGKSKRRYALWNCRPRPERHGHESLFTGGKLHRCQRFRSRVRCERSIHRKDFPGAVNSFTRCG
jgi:hypothetical protein